MSDEKTQTEIIDASQARGISAMERAEIDVQISTAKQYPRSITKFKKLAMDMATLDRETAESCFYVLKRGGNKIEGPGVRLAEIVCCSWTNLRFGAQVVGEDESRRNLIAEGFCHDLEMNTRVAIRVVRRITDKHGKRYSDDMIAMTGNAACSIALRNAVFKVVPMAFIKPIYEAARKCAIGDLASLADRRQKAFAHFGKMGISPEQLLQKLEKPSIDDVGLEDVADLVGLTSALREGSTTLDEEFPPLKDSDAAPTTLAEKVAAKAAETKAGSSETNQPKGGTVPPKTETKPEEKETARNPLIDPPTEEEKKRAQEDMILPQKPNSEREPGSEG